MKVTLITETNSDLQVVNAARCSFDKSSQWVHGKDIQGCVTDKDGHCIEQNHLQLSDKDVKLINYLAKHQHISPFFHPQEVFSLSLAVDELLYFMVNANLSGFEWVKQPRPFITRGSLYAWLTNLQYLPVGIASVIYVTLLRDYPVSTEALVPTFETTINHQAIEHFYNGEHGDDALCSVTLCIEAPIFVKRQLETHRRGFVMTDIEDFSQNEVSRRYIDTTPEVYEPEVWRVQSTSAKQGSDSEKMLAQLEHRVMIDTYRYHIYASIMNYDRMNRQGVAHEQSRMVLPLATYTTFWWTGSVKSWKRLLALRLKPDVQSETRELCQLIADTLIESGVTL